MSQRKNRIRQRDERRKERSANDFRGDKYRQMHEQGILGRQDQERYIEMYELVPRERRGLFKAPQEDPTRIDYSSLKEYVIVHRLKERAIESIPLVG